MVYVKPQSLTEQDLLSREEVRLTKVLDLKELLSSEPLKQIYYMHNSFCPLVSSWDKISMGNVPFGEDLGVVQ